MTDMNHSSHTLGLRKQARLAYEPGFSDIEIENSIIAAILGENAVRFIAMCQAAGPFSLYGFISMIRIELIH